MNPLPRQTLIDLGAGHCKFTLIAHEMGFKVVALDARDDRVPEEVKKSIHHPFFIHQDVRDVDLIKFKIVCILGLFYHLEISDQRKLLEKCRGKIVIVDTHYVPKNIANTSCDGYRGLFKNEVESLTSSHKNNRSFWHCEGSLIGMFEEFGFFVTKILPEHYPGRSFFLLRPKID